MASKKWIGENKCKIAIYKGKDENGRSLYHRETVHGDEKTVDLRIAEIETDMHRGEYQEPSKLLFGAFAEEFLEGHAQNVSEGTLENYKGYLKNYIKKDPLARMKVVKIAPLDIQRYINRVATGPRADGKPGTLSAKTVREQLALLKLIFAHACFWQIRKDNPAQYVKAPKVERKAVAFYDSEQAIRFLTAAEGNRFYLFFLFALMTGLRQGELRGALRSSLNLEKCTMLVDNSVRKSGSKSVLKNPKTEGSFATIQFPEWFAPLFKDHFKQVAAERLAYGPTYGKRDNGEPFPEFVFPGQNGRPIAPKILYKHYRQIIEKAELPYIKFHSLRHSCASLLLEVGVDLKRIQEKLRHTDIRTTMNIYGHLIPNAQKVANEKLTELLKIKTR